MHNAAPSPQAFTLKTPEGFEAVINSYGGIVMALNVPTAKHRVIDAVQGYAEITDYPKGNPYQGALVGRYANRIRNARFHLGEEWIDLHANHGSHQLHGGPKGLHNKVWDVESSDESQLSLRTVLPNGCSGFPGDLEVRVTFRVSSPATLRIEYEAVTSEPTVVNLTHHAYFNLNGHAESLHEHTLQVFADNYTETDNELIPTGRILPVEGSALDLRESVALPQYLEEHSEFLASAGGLDHNFVLRKNGSLLQPAAVLSSRNQGLILEVLTDQPGLQVYTANMENSPQPGKHGMAYDKWTAVCLECQHFPDSPNHPEFPTTFLYPGETYRQTTLYRFRNE